MPEISSPFQTLVSGWSEVYGSGSFTEGEKVRLAEARFSNWSRKFSVALNSAGSGLFAIARCLGPQVAVVPNNTFFATGAMVKEAGWEITLADCATDDFCMTPTTILEAAARAEKPVTAVVLTHVGGMALRYREIANMCDERGWLLIEDCAHVFGAMRNGLKPGALGYASVFSFYPTKSVPAGEGGMVATTDTKFAAEIARFRNYGKNTVNGKVEYTSGFNLRMDEWTAVVLAEQIKRVNQIVAGRWYAAQALSEVVKPLVDWDGGSAFYKFVAPASYPATRRAGQIYAKSDQLATAMGIGGKFPNSETIAETHICLPLGETMYRTTTPGEIDAWLRGTL
jgi:dTDP-4-amino-4,6-dideoxygalactose transaminase